MMRRAIYTFFWLSGMLGISTAALAQSIRVESGTYGANCGAREGNITRDLAGHCNTLDTCWYPVASPASYRARHLCKADLSAAWSRGSGERHDAIVRAAANASVEKVESGSRLVDDAGKTMDEIVVQVKRVSDLIAEISFAPLEQSSGITQVSQAVGDLDHITQQNAALVEQSAAASESLKRQTTRLAEAVSAFR